MNKHHSSISEETPKATNTILTPRGNSFSNRIETRTTIESIIKGEHIRTSLENVYGKGPLLLSDIPHNKLSSPQKLKMNMGIDEAGRGPALGPMIYAGAYWDASFDMDSNQEDVRTKFKDSKQLNADVRSKLFHSILESQDIGFSIRILHASEISRNMMRNPPINLNTMSHNAVIEMIQAVLDLEIELETVYVDTVGIPEHYKRKLEQAFQNYSIRFVVEKKADDKYATCSAASVLAKVMRDELMKNWHYSEVFLRNETAKTHDMDFGSGYPSDPKCKSWMEKNLKDLVFGYPDIVRFSWGPAKLALKDKANIVDWPDDGDDDEDAGYEQSSMTAFFSKKNESKKRKRLEFVEKMGLNKVFNITES